MLGEFMADASSHGMLGHDHELGTQMFEEFLNEWVTKHFPFEMGEDIGKGHC
jgi:hypothetical protein